MRKAIIVQIAAVLAIGLVPDHDDAATKQPPQIRIGLLQYQSQVQVTSTTAFQMAEENSGEVIAKAKPGEVWTFRVSGAKPAGFEMIGPQGKVAKVWRGPLWVSLQQNKETNTTSHTGRTADFIKVLNVGQHWDRSKDRCYRGEIQICFSSKRKLSVVNVIDLEEYLRGVVSSEMSHTYPFESLKAQAVAARTKALANLGRHSSDGFDLCNCEHCQVYGGASSEFDSTNRAVEETRGQVLTFQGELANAVYHAVCGGHTENNDDAWSGRPIPYLRGVPDFDADDDCPIGLPLQGKNLERYLRKAPLVNCLQPQFCALDRFRWVKVFSRQELEKLITSVGSIKEIKPLARGVSGRIKKLQIKGSKGTVTLGPELRIRRALGGLKSSAFVVDTHVGSDGLPATFILWGAGWGHGVGMCQVGATGLAARGRSYQEILKYYYRGCQIQKRWQ